MLVSQVMTRKVRTLPESASFKKIVSVLTRHKISGIPIVNKKKKVIGIISEKDLLYSLFPSQEEFYKDVGYYLSHEVIENELGKVKKLKASDIMSTKIITVRPGDHIMKACALLLVHNIRRLPVVENGKLVGIVTTNNIYRNFLNLIG